MITDFHIYFHRYFTFHSLKINKTLKKELTKELKFVVGTFSALTTFYLIFLIEGRQTFLLSTASIKFVNHKTAT